MKKILITGGSGFLGFKLAEKLIIDGENVRIFDNNFRGNFDKFKNFKKLEIVKGDIRNFKSVKKAVLDCDLIIHLAYINGTSNFYEIPEEVLDVGIVGTINILKASLKSKKLKKFVYASSSEVYHKPLKLPADEKEILKIPNPQNSRFSYSSGKIIGEILTFNLLRKTKIKHNIFRPHNVFGPSMGFEHVIPQLLKKIKIKSRGYKKNCTIPIQGSGLETRAFCYVDDAVKQIIKISKFGKNKEIYNIGQNKEITIKKLITDISKILKLKIKIKPGKLMKGSVLRRCPDVKKISKIIKLNNNYLYGLKQTVLWYKNFYLNESK